MLGASCPSCGGEAPPGASRCRGCGFVFFEEREARRRRGRSAPLVIALGALAAGLAGATALLAGRGEPADAPEPPDPLTAARAERRLESRLANAGYDDAAGVRCRRAIRLAGATRCHVRYANGDSQLILVGLDGRGELVITIPYPAQRRPGG